MSKNKNKVKKKKVTGKFYKIDTYRSELIVSAVSHISVTYPTP